jgi:hypothetical protein
MPGVSTFDADMPGAVLHDRPGLLSLHGDAEALAHRLDRLIAQPQLREPMGTAALRHISENNVRKELIRLEDIYAGLLTLRCRSVA